MVFRFPTIFSAIFRFIVIVCFAFLQFQSFFMILGFANDFSLFFRHKKEGCKLSSACKKLDFLENQLLACLMQFFVRLFRLCSFRLIDHRSQPIINTCVSVTFPSIKHDRPITRRQMCDFLSLSSSSSSHSCPCDVDVVKCAR